ncbi:MAG TPA: DUF4097 family beta strand repeat-containing protein [Bdellovibrionota bacterium]|jgi:hypothetical protein
MKIVGIGVLCSAAFAASAYGNEEFRGVRQLEMRVASGDIKVTGVSGDTATMNVVKKRYDERCRLTVEQRGDLLFVELASKNFFSATCEADFTIEVPKNVSLKFKSGSGAIKVEGTKGTMSVETGSGRVDVKAKLSSFSAKTGSGDLLVAGLQSPAKVRTGSGSMRLVYDRLPASGQLDIRTGSGDAQVIFPRHSKVKTSYTAGSGVLKNELGESREAHFSVNMTSGSGDLTVGKF